MKPLESVTNTDRSATTGLRTERSMVPQLGSVITINCYLHCGRLEQIQGDGPFSRKNHKQDNCTGA